MRDPSGPQVSRFRVRSLEADARGRLAPHALCGFLQEAAWHDAARLGASTAWLKDRGLAWVLQRLRLEVEEYPPLGSDLSVATWPRRFERVMAQREFVVEDGDGRRLAAGTSRWVVLDLASRKIARMPAEFLELPAGQRPPPLELSAGNLPELDAPGSERRFEVRRADIDATGHVNNTVYVAWLLESVPDAVFEGGEPRALEVTFRREVLYGDAVVSHCRARGDGTDFVHALRSAQDGGELVRAVSSWRAGRGKA